MVKKFKIFMITLLILVVSVSGNTFADEIPSEITQTKTWSNVNTNPITETYTVNPTHICRIKVNTISAAASKIPYSIGYEVNGTATLTVTCDSSETPIASKSWDTSTKVILWGNASNGNGFALQWDVNEDLFFNIPIDATKVTVSMKISSDSVDASVLNNTVKNGSFTTYWATSPYIPNSTNLM